MPNFESLVNARLNAMTAIWSDDYHAVSRDWQTYTELLDSQTEFTDEQITAVASDLYNGKKTRAEVFGEQKELGL